MALYRVKPGHVLPQTGKLLAAGDVVELTDDQAHDIAINYRVEPADLGEGVDIVAEDLATKQGADRPTQE